MGLSYLIFPSLTEVKMESYTVCMVPSTLLLHIFLPTNRKKSHTALGGKPGALPIILLAVDGKLTSTMVKMAPSDSDI